MNQPAVISATTLEDDLLLPSWGAWAREGMSATKYPGWVILMMQGYRESRPAAEPVSDDYALKIDRLIAGLPEPTKSVIYSLYVCGKSINYIAGVQKRSRIAIAQDRDAALWYLYGALKASNHT